MDEKSNEVSTIDMDQYLEQEEARLADDLSRVSERKKSENQLKMKIILSVICICVSGIISSSYAIGSRYKREKGRRYKEAQVLQERGMYQDAIDVYDTLYGYKNSKSNITVCKKEMATAKEKWTYNSAVKSFDNKDYLTAANLFTQVKDYSDAKEKVKESYYYYAKDLVSKADYANAYDAFVKAADYSDAALLASKYKMASASLASNVTFGKFEQDGNEANGAESIDWYVIAKSETQVILLSRYALALMPYNEDGKAVEFANSTIRTYLNDTFYNTAFSTEEKAAIVPTKITQGTSESENSVFLLSSEMFDKYVTTSIMKVAKASEAAKPNTSYSGRSTFWWTCSPSGEKVIAVGTSGTPYATSANINYGIRPVICVDFTK